MYFLLYSFKWTVLGNKKDESIALDWRDLDSSCTWKTDKHRQTCMHTYIIYSYLSFAYNLHIFLKLWKQKTSWSHAGWREVIWLLFWYLIVILTNLQSGASLQYGVISSCSSNLKLFNMQNWSETYSGFMHGLTHPLMLLHHYTWICLKVAYLYHQHKSSIKVHL